MLNRGLSLYLLCFISAKAEEKEVHTAQETSTRRERLESNIQNSRKNFTVELSAAKLSPEERAIRIEQWQKKQAPLLKQAHEARTAPLRSDKIAPTTAAFPISPATQEIPSDPILKDIQEIEAEIGDFRKSLQTAKLTPEQRAIQVEQFHQINRPALTELEKLKRQAARQDLPVEASAEEAMVPPTAPQSELRRIMHDLAETDPETRAEYIEAHAATLAVMTNSIRANSDGHSEIPTNQQPLIQNQKPTKP